MSNASQSHKLNVHGVSSDGKKKAIFKTEVPDLSWPNNQFRSIEFASYLLANGWVLTQRNSPVWEISEPVGNLVLNTTAGSYGGLAGAGGIGTYKLRVFIKGDGFVSYSNWFTLTIT